MIKIEIRKDCKLCHKKITANRSRTYCSQHCRRLFHSRKNQQRSIDWHRTNNDKLATIKDLNKVKCLICGRYYVQIGTHVVQRHKFNTCREYREEFDLEVKRGIVPKWYRKLKGDIALENKTYKNLKIGKKYRFKKGDKKVGVYKRSHITLERLKNIQKMSH
jgi:hypothetical protein